MNSRHVGFVFLLPVLFVLSLMFSESAAGQDTCLSACGGQSLTSFCYCDSICASHFDCCPDYEELCGSDKPDPGPPDVPCEPESASCDPEDDLYLDSEPPLDVSAPSK